MIPKKKKIIIPEKYHPICSQNALPIMTPTPTFQYSQI